MKKFIPLLLVLILVIALVAPAMALSSNMTYKRENNTIAETNYSIELGASASRATAEVTYGKNANLSVQIGATLINTNSHTYAEILNTSDFSTGLSVSTNTILRGFAMKRTVTLIIICDLFIVYMHLYSFKNGQIYCPE